MSNDACGVMKVVAKKRETIERLYKILKYEDDEYCLSRCKYAVISEKPEKDGKYWVAVFNVDGAWSCEHFFNYGDHPEFHLKSYARNKDGSLDTSREIEHTTHLTDLSHLAEKMDFGCMLWSCEPGCCFAERAVVNHFGECDYSTAEYEEHYKEDEDGNATDSEPEINCGFGDEYGEWLYNNEIYG